MRLTERRAMLYSPYFWKGLNKHLSPFADERELLLAAIAQHTQVSVDRVQKCYCAYLRAQWGMIAGNGNIH